MLDELKLAWPWTDNLWLLQTVDILIHKEKNPTRCNNASRFYYSIFIWNSTCFRRHTAYYQETKTALTASGFYTWKVVGRVDGGCCQAQAWQRPPITRPTTFHIWKTRGCQCSFRLLMMGGVSPETCWASYKYGIIKVWYIIASCWIFFFMNCTMMHGSMNIKPPVLFSKW